MDNVNEKIKLYISDHLQEMILDVSSLVEIPSTRGASTEAMPYGIGPYTVLKKAEELLSQNELKVTNYDNRIISADLTDLEPGLDILAHLDVVPCENNWTVTDPYFPVLKDGKLFGRGTIDDKGPAIAALYAMKCVRELHVPLKRNVRLILGCDEECGSSDVEYYYKNVTEAPMTFTPDANFPLINLEKGRYLGEYVISISDMHFEKCIDEITCGVKSNVIPEHAEAVITGIPIETVMNCAEEIFSKTNGIKVETNSAGDKTIIHVYGKGGHAAYPENAENALTALLKLLSVLPFDECALINIIKNLSSLFPHGDWRGQALGISMEDQISGYLTCSADCLNYKNSELSFVFDVRCPVCSNETNVKQSAEQAFKKYGMNLQDNAMILPHYVPENSAFVSTLLRVYEEWTGKHEAAQSTGGGTYVHELKNGVAFGCEIEGIDNHLHGADEFITIEQLTFSAEIFAKAIIELCT